MKPSPKPSWHLDWPRTQPVSTRVLPTSDRTAGRRGPRAAHGRGGHDRWLLSYADLVTLLLALFTVLYAASTVDAVKMSPVANSVREAFEAPRIAGVLTAGAATVVPPLAVVPERGRAEQDLQLRLARELADALRSERVELHRDARGLIVSLPEEAAFPVGSADASAEARALIRRLAAALADAPNAIRIEGHTDDVPIRTPRFASNWELSTARASAVVAFLVQEAGVAPTRLSAAGYGEFHPRVPNDSAANRARNRRIDIVVLEPAGSAAR